MNIFQIIKNFIDKITNKKLKLLTEGVNSKYYKELNQKHDNINFFSTLQKEEFTENNIKLSKADTFENNKAKEVLKAIGCQKEIFQKVQDFSNIDLENLKNNLKVLSKYNYNKLEFSKIITENIELLYINNNELEKNLIKLNNIFGKNEIKSLIYSYSPCLTLDIEKTIESLEEYKIPDFIQKYILLENPLIFGIEKIKLVEQLEYIYNSCNDYEKFLVVLMCNCIFIGTNQLELITI